MAEELRGGAVHATAAQVERVLEAERRAEQRLVEAKRRAEALRAAASARSEEIRKRADERISRLHVAMRRRVDAEIAHRRQEFAAAAAATQDDPHASIGRAALERAVHRLAADLTGGDDAPAG
jgi:ElaB/YqjD/DUF883 family membrane-anchored ribosome-binding protein